MMNTVSLPRTAVKISIESGNLVEVREISSVFCILSGNLYDTYIVDNCWYLLLILSNVYRIAN